MVKAIIDYKPTTQKSNCKLCNKLIIKGQKRITLTNDNTYQKETLSMHLKCFKEKIEKFESSVPENKLEINYDIEQKQKV